jgi:hypothetical protein
VAAEHEDARVEQDEAVGEGRQRETPVRQNQDRQGDERGRDLQEPGEAVVNPDARQDEQRDPGPEQDGRLAPARRIADRASRDRYSDSASGSPSRPVRS